jgi:N-acetylmuramic acid 6-phosphate (MurNAc-6-P) etherase
MKKSYNDILAEIILEEKKKEKRRQKRLKTLEPKSSKKEIKTEKTQELKAIEEQFKEIEVNIKINMKKILSSGKLFNIILTGTGLGKTLGFAI